MTSLSSFSQLVDAFFCWYLIALPPPSPTTNTDDSSSSRGEVELQSNPVHSTLITESTTLEVEVDRESELNHSSNNDNTNTTTTWMHQLQHCQRLYDFAVLTAIVYPTTTTITTSSQKSIYTENEIRWKQRWVICCHICSTIHVLVAIISACILIPVITTPEGLAVIIIQTLADCLPIITIMPAIFILKRSLTHSLVCKPKPNKEDIDSSVSTLTTTTSISKSITTTRPTCSENQLTRLNPIIIQSIINHALSVSKIVLFPLALAPLLWGIVEIINVAILFKSEVVSFLVPILLTAWTMIPPTAMLIGILTYLIMDQCYSYYMLLEMRQKALSNEVIDTVYLSIGKRLVERDAKSPLNFLVGIALIIVVLCSIDLIYYNASNNDVSINAHITTSISLVYYASKEVAVLLVIIYYMRAVNDMADQFLYQVSRRVSSDIQDEALRIRRLELLSMMKDYRIGSTVFYQRPSTTQLMVQFVSLFAAILSAVGKLLFNAIT